MNDAEKKALLGICLIAAFADGEKSEPERVLIERTGAGLNLGPFDVPEFYEHAQTGLLDIEALTPSLVTIENRLLAYEMALGICEADNLINSAERVFLDKLQRALGLDDASIRAAQATTRQLQAQVVAPQLPPTPDLPGSPPPMTGPERLILEHAILCGALEQMPETLATMAILPTQMKMVRLLGQIHGLDLDRHDIKSFFQATGAGLTAQTVQGYAARLAKGVLGRVMGGSARPTVISTPAAATAFATAYALGQVADQFFARDRNQSAAELKAAFEAARASASAIQATYAAEIEACRRDVRLQNLLPARGPAA